MYPTLKNGDIVWINKVNLNHFNKNDIVAFERNSENYVKRIVGAPSDSVYKSDRSYSVIPDKNTLNQPIYTIPKKGQNIHLDNTNSDFYLPLIEKYEKVQAGKLLDKIYINNSISNNYTFKQNYYFVQGDNTEGSIDSREWGLISENQLIGTSFYIQKKTTP
jgi:signal peptidase I